MNYNVNPIIYCFLLIVKNIQCSKIKTKYRHFDVDDFLKQVMVSEKFDELAGKIADKAVEKFKKLHLNNKPAFVSEKETVYRVSSSDANDQNNESEEVTKQPKKSIEVHDVEPKIKNVNLKIDTEAFKRKEAKLSKDVSLKYNKFIKNVGKPSKENFPTSDDEESKPYTQKTGPSDDDDTITTTTARETMNMSYDLDKDNDVVNRDFVSKEKTQKSSKNPYKVSIFERDQHEVSTKYLERSDNEDSHQMTKENTEFNFGRDGTVESNSKEVKNIDTKENESEEIVRNRAYEYLQLPLSKGNQDDEKKTKDTDKIDSRKEMEKKQSDVKQIIQKTAHKADRIIRKEGNKLFTFQRSPDYAEYDQEIARIKEQFNNNKKKGAS